MLACELGLLYDGLFWWGGCGCDLSCFCCLRVSWVWLIVVVCFGGVLGCLLASSVSGFWISGLMASF